MMNIGILGTGNMGRHLGLLWAEQGHEVFFGSRTLAHAEHAREISEGTTHAGTIDEAAEFGDVLLYTIRGVDPAELVVDESVFDGKLVIDCNNSDVPPDEDYPGVDFSLAEELQRKIPKARVVKAFNTMSTEVMELCPDLIAEYDVSVFIAGDDPAARDVVAKLATDIGMSPVDSGALAASRRIETIARFVITQIIRSGDFTTTISIRKLPDPPRAPRLGGRRMSEQTKADLAGLDG